MAGYLGKLPSIQCRTRFKGISTCGRVECMLRYLTRSVGVLNLTAGAFSSHLEGIAPGIVRSVSLIRAM